MDNQYNLDRNHEIYKLHEKGLSYGVIGKQFGISKERVRQIYLREARRIKSEQEHAKAVETSGRYTFYDALLEIGTPGTMATRIYRCLTRSGIQQEMFDNHSSLDKYSDDYLLLIRNFGASSLIFARKANEIYKLRMGI